MSSGGSLSHLRKAPRVFPTQRMEIWAPLASLLISHSDGCFQCSGPRVSDTSGKCFECVALKTPLGGVRVNVQQPGTTMIAPRARDECASLITGGAASFVRDWNVGSFAFSHGLANCPLLSVQSLREVARRIPDFPGFVHWQNGQIQVTDKWETNTAPRLSLDETLRDIETNNSQVILKHAEQDREIGPVLRALLEEIVDLSPPRMRDEMTIGESIIFVSSPRRVTKYHLDLEANYLLQVSGSKTAHVFDPARFPTKSSKPNVAAIKTRRAIGPT